MAYYIKCPRCDLNYIDGEKQTYCDVCQKEMKGIRTDADELEEEEESELATELCPICGENMMRAGEKMCEECRAKEDIDKEEPDPEEDTEWQNYLEDDLDDADSDIELDPSLEEEFSEDIDEIEEEEEYEYDNSEEEDLEYVTGDEIYTLSGGDDDDDDEEDDDDF